MDLSWRRGNDELSAGAVGVGSRLGLAKKRAVGAVLRVGSSDPACSEVVDGELSDSDLVVIGETSSRSP